MKANYKRRSINKIGKKYISLDLKRMFFPMPSPSLASPYCDDILSDYWDQAKLEDFTDKDFSCSGELKG
jgi:hypothetical protein